MLPTTVFETARWERTPKIGTIAPLSGHRFAVTPPRFPKPAESPPPITACTSVLATVMHTVLAMLQTLQFTRFNYARFWRLPRAHHPLWMRYNPHKTLSSQNYRNHGAKIACDLVTTTVCSCSAQLVLLQQRTPASQGDHPQDSCFRKRRWTAAWQPPSGPDWHRTAPGSRSTHGVPPADPQQHAISVINVPVPRSHLISTLSYDAQRTSTSIQAYSQGCLQEQSSLAISWTAHRLLSPQTHLNTCPSTATRANKHCILLSDHLRVL